MMRQQTKDAAMSAEREEACAKLIRQGRVSIDADGTGEPALTNIRTLLVNRANQVEALFARTDFARTDFAMPDGRGRK
jgi:hypothetical protein